MKVILTEKITKLGNIGDTVEVKTGFARNYLLPNGKAMRFTRENVALFEAKKAELTARQEAAKKNAEANVDAVKNAKLHMIRQAGDTGQLYGSVSTRDIARMLKEVANVSIESAQVMLGAPIKSVGAFDTTIALHPDVIVPVKIYVAQTQDEIDALVAGKSLTFGTKKVEEVEEEVVAEPVITPVESGSPFLSDETVVATPPKPIVDMVVDKPAYNVSQNEKMFVADPEYETDVVEQEEIETCANGNAPDADGCCAGEELVDMGDGTLMCCAIGTDECFPPMF